MCQNRPHVHIIYFGGTFWNKVFYKGINDTTGAVYWWPLVSKLIMGIGCSCLQLPRSPWFLREERLGQGNLGWKMSEAQEGILLACSEIQRAHAHCISHFHRVMIPCGEAISGLMGIQGCRPRRNYLVATVHPFSPLKVSSFLLAVTLTQHGCAKPTRLE